MLRVLGCCLAVSLLAGCMGVPIDATTAPRAAQNYYLDPQVSESGPGKGLVRVARDKGGWGKYQPALIYVDGRHVANVLENTVLELNLPVGPHKVGLQMVDRAHPIDYLDVQVKDGQPVGLRAYVGATMTIFEPIK